MIKSATQLPGFRIGEVNAGEKIAVVQIDNMSLTY